MEGKNFQDYYQEVKERDERIANEKPLPNPEGVNVWIVFGLSLGIASIMFSLINKYSIVLAVLALIFSFVGYRKKVNKVATAGIVCSAVGLILGVICAIGRYLLMESINSIWQNFIESISK